VRPGQQVQQEPPEWVLAPNQALEICCPLPLQDKPQFLKLCANVRENYGFLTGLKMQFILSYFVHNSDEFSKRS
jgi:hypothetical protein